MTTIRHCSIGFGAFVGDLPSDALAQSCPSVDECTRVGGILQDRRHRGCRRPSPTQIAMTIAARQVETAVVELAHHLGDSSHLQEGPEQQPSRSCTSKFGSLTTTPEGSRIRPIGKVSASSPRSALARRPAVNRLRIVCNSSSAIVPFSPRSNRPFELPDHRRHHDRQ